MAKLRVFFRKLAAGVLIVGVVALLLLALILVVVVSDGVTAGARVTGQIVAALAVLLAVVAAYGSWRLSSDPGARSQRVPWRAQLAAQLRSSPSLWAFCRTLLFFLIALSALIGASVTTDRGSAALRAAVALAFSTLTVLSSERLSTRFKVGADLGWWRNGGFGPWLLLMVYVPLPLAVWLLWLAPDDYEPWQPPAYDMLPTTTGVLAKSEHELSVKPERGERVYFHCGYYTRRRASCWDIDLDRYAGQVVTVRHEALSRGGRYEVLAYEIRTRDQVLLSFADMVEHRAFTDAARAASDRQMTGFLPASTTILLITPLIVSVVQRPRRWQRYRADGKLRPDEASAV